MLFQQLRPSNQLQVSLRAAIASHRPAALKIMFDHHGERVFAQALSGLSQRVVADALSMLPAADRSRAQQHLPRALRHCIGKTADPHAARLSALAASLHH